MAGGLPSPNNIFAASSRQICQPEHNHHKELGSVESKLRNKIVLDDFQSVLSDTLNSNYSTISNWWFEIVNRLSNHLQWRIWDSRFRIDREDENLIFEFCEAVTDWNGMISICLRNLWEKKISYAWFVGKKVNFTLIFHIKRNMQVYNVSYIMYLEETYVSGWLIF